MKTLLKLKTLAVAAGIFGLSVVGANALVIEPFPEKSKDLPDPYFSQGFVWTPTTSSSGQCYGAVCLKEAGVQAVFTSVARQDGGTFDFLGAYINLDGTGSGDNFLKIASNILNDEIILGIKTDYSGSPYLSIFTAFDDKPVKNEPAGTQKFELTKGSAGYFVLFDNLFKGVTSISFTALGSANVRLDCAAMTTTGESIAYSDISQCAPTTTTVPVPASLQLLGAGLGLMGAFAVRRRRRAA